MVIPRTSTLSIAPANLSAITAVASIVGAGIVTDAVSASTSAVVIVDTITIYESGACANVVTRTIAVGIHILGTDITVTLDVLGSNNSCGERDQCND